MTEGQIMKILEPTYNTNEKVALVEISIPGLVEMLEHSMKNTEEIVDLLSKEKKNHVILADFIFYKEYFFNTILEKLNIVREKQVIDRELYDFLADKVVCILDEIKGLKTNYI